MRLREIAAALVLLAASTGDSLAQQAVTVPPGSRVRVSLRATTTNPMRDAIVGSLMSLQSDTVIVREKADHPDLAVPLTYVRTFEVSRGRKSGAGKGALIGLLGGAAGGVGAALIACDGECDSSMGNLTGLVGAVLGIGGGLFGAGVGALVGGRFHHDLWEKVPVRDLRMGLDPLRESGPRFLLSMNF